MKRTKGGTWEHDFRLVDLPRYHATYGTKKADAERLHAVAVAVFRSRDIAVIEALKTGRVTLEQLAQLRERHLPFVAALPTVADVMPWPTFGDAVPLYIAGIRKNPHRAEGTARAATVQLNRALSFVGTAPRLDDVTAARVTDYQAQLTAEGKARNTVTSYVWRVAAMYRWFIRQEAIAARDEKRTARVLHVPFNAEEISVEKTGRQRYLTEAEAARLLAVTPKPLLAPVMLGLFAGLRVDEMIHLRTGFDVDFERGVVRVQVQPGWKPKSKRGVRTVPMSDALRPALERHTRYSSEHWFTPSAENNAKPLNRHTFDTHFGTILKDAGLLPGRKNPEGVTYHTLRHTFASWLIMRGADLFTVAQLLGNMVQQVEKTYGHLSIDHRTTTVNKLTGAVDFSPPSSTKGR